MAKLLFNRFHISSQRPPKDKKQIFIEGLNSKISTGQGLYAYRIMDINTTYEGYIIGNLVKYMPYDEGEFVDEDNSKITEGIVSNRIIAKSFFFINLSESIIVFEEIRNIISKPTFINTFTKLFNSAFEKDFTTSIQIDTLKEQYSFVDKVKELKYIDKVVISLVPSNPRYNPRWEKMDKRLQENDVTSYREIQTSNKKQGLKVDEETESKMMMAEDGYGESTASGKDEKGRSVTFSTKSRNQDVSQPLPNGVRQQGFSAILNHISQTMDSIISRTKK